MADFSRLRLLGTLGLLGGLVLGCTVTDVKGDTCPQADAFQTAAGDLYCLDPAAPSDCERVVDEIIDAFVTCGDGAFTEAELLDELERAGVSFECEAAVATSTDYEECLDQLQEPTCADGVAQISAECEGSVLAPEPEE